MLKSRRCGALALTLVACTAFAAPAAESHQGNPNYRSTVTGLTPSVPGLTLSILNYDDRVALLNRSGRTVVVHGYDGEPYVRVLADGTVQVNHRSPAFYLNSDRFAAVDVPATADAKARPAWQTVDRTGRYEWHDHRVHWMGTGDPPQLTDKSKRTKIFDWRIPVEAGSTPAVVTGTLSWEPPAGGGVPLGAVIGLVAVALGGVGLVVIVRRRRRAPGDGDGDGPEPGDGPAPTVTAPEAEEAW